MSWIKRDTRQRFARLELVRFCHRPSHFDENTLGFLANEVVLWRVRALAFGNESKGKSNPCRLILRPWRSTHDESHKTIRAQSYLHRLVGSHASGRKQINS